MSFVPRLHVFKDTAARSAAMQMAIDEALFARATVPALRFYRWRQPSLSFGYFGAFAEVAGEADRRELVRRWTGGGIVFHGADLTYAIVLPRNDAAPLPPSRIVYAEIHRALQHALGPELRAELAHGDAPKVSAACFANPVAADVLVHGRKVAGAAQRRTRAGLLQQGSIQLENLPDDFPDAFAAALSPGAEERLLSPEILRHAGELTTNKYATAAWLRQR